MNLNIGRANLFLLSGKKFSLVSLNLHLILLFVGYMYLFLDCYEEQIRKDDQIHLMLEAKFGNDSKLTNFVTKKRCLTKKEDFGVKNSKHHL